MNFIETKIFKALINIYKKHNLKPSEAISATANAFSNILHIVAIATGYADNDEKANEFALDAYKQIVDQLENKK